MNKKLRKIARLSALSYKESNKEILVVEDFNFETPKTKQYIEMLNKFELFGKKTLLVLPGINENIYLSSKNVQKAKIASAADLNTYDVLNANKIIIAESSLAELDQLFSE